MVKANGFIDFIFYFNDSETNQKLAGEQDQHVSSIVTHFAQQIQESLGDAVVNTLFSPPKS